MQSYFTGSIPVHIELQVLLGSWLLHRGGFEIDSPVGFELAMELFRKPEQRVAIANFDDGWEPMRLTEDNTHAESFRRWFTPYVMLAFIARDLDAPGILDLARRACRDGAASEDDLMASLENLAPLARRRGEADIVEVDRHIADPLVELYELAFEDGEDSLRQLLLLAPARRRIPELWYQFRQSAAGRATEVNFGAFQTRLMRRIGA